MGGLGADGRKNERRGWDDMIGSDRIGQDSIERSGESEGSERERGDLGSIYYNHLNFPGEIKV